MSFHILHIREHGCKIFKERGFIVCQKDGRSLGRMALKDVRALILISEGISISGALLSSLLSFDAVVLHCANYKPIGLTLPLQRVYDGQTIINQTSASKKLKAQIWEKLLRAKVANNISVLDFAKTKNIRLCGMFENKRRPLDEGLCAKAYWKSYFPALGAYGETRAQGDSSSKVNVMLNYGYGVIGALIHRAILVHGLSPLFGVCHKTYYKNTPLVYDMIEPFRGIIDLLLYEHIMSNDVCSLQTWSTFLGNMMREYRLKRGNFTLKLMDAVDFSVSSLANCYKNGRSDDLWVPYINLKYEKKRKKESV